MESKKKLSSGKWLILFFVTALVLAVLSVSVFNLVTDPSGAFGDPVLPWWSYDMTKSPRIAKLRYLEQNHEAYDSYLVGDSAAGAIPVELLDRCMDARFFNAFSYGDDTEGFEETAVYLLEHFPTKNLVLDLSMLLGASRHQTEPGYWKAEGSGALWYYLRSLFASPREGIRKLQCRKSVGYLPTDCNVIRSDTGAYDRVARDVEHIGALEPYLAGDASWDASREATEPSIDRAELERSVEAVRRIKALCEEKGVKLTVLLHPMYCKDLARFSPEDQAAVCNALAQVTDYWDFTLSSVSYEPRYFYDGAHFRSAVGEMLLARIFADGSVYVPEDLGRWVEQGSVPGAPTGGPAAEEDYTARVSILCYHDIVASGQGSETQVPVALFAEQMAALAAAGYTSVDIWQMRDYVEKGGSLPEKAVLITFDDGYESNYSLAYPVLKEYGFKATIFSIGVSMGKTSYKDTDTPILPHFSLEQAEEMTASGLITVASHGYDVHEVEGLDRDPVRPGALQREGETEAEYVAYLTRDALRMRELLGEAAGFFSYPMSMHDTRCLAILKQAGVFATVCGEAPETTLIRGLPQCLYDMPRQVVTETMSGADLVEALEQTP